MKKTLKAKILLGLFSVSCALGQAYSDVAFAGGTPPKAMSQKSAGKRMMPRVARRRSRNARALRRNRFSEASSENSSQRAVRRESSAEQAMPEDVRQESSLDSPPPEVARQEFAVDTAQPRILSVAEMNSAYTCATLIFYLTGDRRAIGAVVNDVLEGHIRMQIGGIGRLATIEEICEALQVAYNYYLISGGNYILINLVREYIRANRINVNADDGRLIHTAVALGPGCFGFLKFLLYNCHANINITTKPSEGGNTPLHTAIKFKQYDIADFLKNYGARQDIRDANGRLPEDCY